MRCKGISLSLSALIRYRSDLSLTNIPNYPILSRPVFFKSNSFVLYLHLSEVITFRQGYLFFSLSVDYLFFLSVD